MAVEDVRALMYVLVPMPWLFFGNADSDSLYADSSLKASWIDAGKFLTGFSAVGSIAIPSILYHAEKITGGALVMELCAMALLGSTVLLYDYLKSTSDGLTYY